MNLYEPSLPDVSAREDLTEAHLAWVEDLVLGYTREAGCSMEHIAWLEQEAQ